MTATAPIATQRRVRARVAGTVQGVGFRPYVYRLARGLGLTGFVLNDSRGVLLEVEGEPGAVEQFLLRLGPEAPPLAVLEGVIATEQPPCGERTFAIRASPGGEPADAPVAPDSATCPDCLSELFDPGDRRFRYPFINCTNCGPRFTIVRGVPYDRPRTTMAGFAMCPACQAEYDDPSDRRFHAQPNACPVCGPSVSLLGGEGDPLQSAAGALRDGLIVAIKGIGGFHLACRADDEAAVGALRARKHREDKPFALMVGHLEAARGLVSLGAHDEALLQSRERPIVLAPRRADGPVARSVAPGARELGVMLPYSPLHHLLLADAGTTLVMTSGNISEEPIAYANEDARARLASIADLVLVHDRPIETRTDDSVVRAISVPGGPRTLFMRRSRGYVPARMALPDAAERPLLACGAELKNTFCVARGSWAWVGHHIGDLSNYETLCSFTDGIAHFQELFAVTPEVVVHDLHPEYLSTKYALARDGVELIGVQHHHAHMAACLAEHGERGPAIGAIFDGTGFGTDGTVWGGELLRGDLAGFSRLGALRPVRMPGGERAIREPWRMACAWLVALADASEETPPVPRRLAEVEPRAWRQVAHLARTGLSSPQTTSMGRLFDAVAAICGVRARVNYEGQAAIELEAACDPHERGRYPIGLTRGADGELVVDPLETIAAALADADAGVGTGVVASRFHRAVAAVTIEACASAAADHDIETIVLSGGVFGNRRLLEATASGLAAAGLRVLLPERMPIGDGGISYGQAAVAAARMAAGRR